jgi:hypothetical protein
MFIYFPGPVLDALYADRLYSQNGWSCLMGAADNGHLEVVKYLVEVGSKELLMLTLNVRTCSVC